MKSQRFVGYASIALGVGSGASAILGPLVLKVIKFRTSADIENQFIGGEVASLGLAAPAPVIAGTLWLVSSRWPVWPSIAWC